MNVMSAEKRREFRARLLTAIDSVHLVERADGVEVLAAELAHGAGGEAEALEALKGTGAERAKLLALAKAGQIDRLVVNATTFIQRPKASNRNYVRVKPGAMQALASSFVGLPMLKDHNTDLDARGGTILESKLERAETADGTEYRIKMRIELVKGWAILAALDGTLDRWSISFGRADGDVLCSIHETPVFSKCYCWRGETVEINGEKRKVEFLYTKADGREVSGVSVPAVVGTGIDTIDALRAELSAEGVDLGSLVGPAWASPPSRRNAMNDLAMLAAILGLAATASLEEVSGSINKLKTDAAAAQDARDVALEERDTARASLAAIETELGELKAKDTAEKVEASIAALKAAGKIAPGGKAEKALRNTAARDFALFEAQAAEMLEAGAAVTPAGGKRQAAEPITKPIGNDRKPTDQALDENPQLGGWLGKAGISKTDFEKHGAQAVANLQAIAEAQQS